MTENGRRRLDEWERRLARELGGVTLVGELDLTKAETHELGALLGQVATWYHDRGENVTRRLRQRWPHALTAFLVFQGRFGYDDGDYWGTVRQVIRVPFSEEQWGQIFESILDDLGLQRDYGGFRYVSAILGHGGIPSDCLPDFFGQLLEPSQQRADWAGLNTDALIRAWLTYAATHHVDTPVRRFLEKGERVAQDFVTGCRRMACLALTGKALQAHDLGLPETVVDAYETWLDGQADASERVGRPRWRHPSLCLDPHRDGVYVWLPGQRLDRERRRSTLRWVIQDGDESHEVVAEARHIEGQWQTTQAQVSLHHPTARYRVQLWLDDTLARAWRLSAYDEVWPLLVFSAETATSLLDTPTLPDEPVWLVCPQECHLKFLPSAPHGLQRIPPLPGDWQTWKGCAVDLAGIEQIIFKTPQTSRTWAVAPPDALREATLEGTIVAGLWTDHERVFVGAPRLRIPWQTTGESMGQLNAWTVELVLVEGRPPLRRGPHPFATLGLARRHAADLWELRLDEPALLGLHPFGAYTLRVRDHQGRTREFSFRTVPHLTLLGHEALVVPNEDGQAPTAELRLYVDTATHVSLSRQAQGVTIARFALPDASDYRLTVEPGYSYVPLVLTRHGVSLHLDVRVPRLRWRVMVRTTDLADEPWRDNITSLSWDELVQSEEPSLLVDAPMLGAEAHVSLRFEGADGQTLLTLSPFHSRARDSVWRFDLRQARDTLRQHALARAFVLVDGIQRAPIQRAALSLQRQLRLDDLRVERGVDGDQHWLDLAWQPNLRLTARQVRLWPLSRPWDAPTVVALPDEVDNRYRHPLAAPLPAGTYAAEFTVHNPWRSQAGGQPDLSAPNVRRVQIGCAEDRWRELDDALRLKPTCFTLHLERACLAHDLQQSREWEREVLWCLRHVEPSNGPLVDHLLSRIDGEDSRPLRIRLGAPDIIRTMLRGWAEAPHISAFERYFALLSPANLTWEACQSLLHPATPSTLTAATKSRLGQLAGRLPIEKVIQLAREGSLTTEEVASLLVERQEEAASVLLTQLHDPLAVALLDPLAKRNAKLSTRYIRPGMWVRCQAGWGHLDAILGPEGQPVAGAPRPLRSGYRLQVTLRAGRPEQEAVVIGLAPDEVRFQEARHIYVCTVCDAFATQHQKVFYWQHRCRQHHAGTPSHLRCKPELAQRAPLTFLTVAPPDPWA